MTDLETLVSQVFPYVKHAVIAYGKTVPSKSENTAASSTAQLGQRLLAIILERAKSKSKIEGVVARLSRSPEDPGATWELHNEIRQALQGDPNLARDLSAVVGHHNVIVYGNQQGPIHLGNKTNVYHPDRKISGFAITALVLGLLGFLIFPIPIAIGFGLFALTRVLRSPSSVQAPATSQASSGGATGPGGQPMAAGPQESMIDSAGSTGMDSGTTVHSPPPVEPTRSAESTGAPEPGVDPGSVTPDGFTGETGLPNTGTTPSGVPDTPVTEAPVASNGSMGPAETASTGTPPGGAPDTPVAPDGSVGQAAPTPDMFPSPSFESAAASTPYAPPAAGAAAPFVPATGGGFAAAKAISIVFSLMGLLAAGLWGLGWTAAVVIVAQESGSYASEDTNQPFPDMDGEGEVPSPADLCEPSPGYATVCTLETGDCFIEPAATEFYEVELTSCSESHNAQVIGSYVPSGGDWPGWAAFGADVENTCGPMSESVLDPARTPDTYYVGYIAPNENSWDYGIQEAFCYVSADGESWTTSLTS